MANGNCLSRISTELYQAFRLSPRRADVPLECATYPDQHGAKRQQASRRHDRRHRIYPGHGIIYWLHNCHPSDDGKPPSRKDDPRPDRCLSCCAHAYSGGVAEPHDEVDRIT
jgi:hypothetical protein